MEPSSKKQGGRGGHDLWEEVKGRETYPVKREIESERERRPVNMGGDGCPDRER